MDPEDIEAMQYVEHTKHLEEIWRKIEKEIREGTFKGIVRDPFWRYK